MTEPAEDRPLKRTIPPYLQTQVEEIQKKIPRTTGPSDDLDDRRKRWLIVGICLHMIISPVLRTYVVNVVTKLCYSLTSRNKIHKQTYGSFLERYAPTNTHLNYQAINNNKTKRSKAQYDYRVKTPVDFSRLFLQTHMAHFTAFDDSCDSSALLGIIVNIDRFPAVVQADARKIRSDIRNPWAHCDFTEWTATKYADSFQLMGQLISNLNLSNREENRILGELNRWAMNGQHFLRGTTLGLEIVGDIRQQTHVLSRYVQTLCSETDSQFIRVEKQLSRIEKDLQENEEKIKSLESKTNEHDETLNEHDETLNKLKKEIKKQVEDHVPPHIRAHHGQEIREWEQDQTAFVKTRATHHILESLPSHNCIVVTGSSGCGKSSNIHQAALHFRDSFGYEIIPVLTGPTDIINYYNENKKQVFVVDDICGKETINTQTLQMWRDYSEKMEKIFKDVETDAGGKHDGKVFKVSSPKLLISCRLHIYKESQFQRITLLTRNECNLLSPELCLLEDERMHMLQKYLPDDIIYNIGEVTQNVDYFPLLCKLSKDKTSEEVKKLFTAPLTSIKKNINNIINENKEQSCALTLCIIFSDGFNTDWLKKGSVSVNKTYKLEDIVKEFDIDLSKEMHRNSLKAGFSTLNGTYLKLRGTEYRMIHDKIYNMAAVICGQHLKECFIKYAPSIFIRDHFIFESLQEVLGNDDSIVLIKDQEEDYFERLLCDLKEHVITSTFHNSQLISQIFRDKLISFLRGSDDAKTVLKNIDTQGCTIKNDHDELEYPKKGTYYEPFESDLYTTPLIESVITGYIDIVQFLIISVKCNVNKTDRKDCSPLYKASERGHSAVVKFLLENNADKSQCNKYRMSPLYIASKGGHTDIIKMLLQKNAEVSVYDIIGETPLFVACREGHEETVELLLKNNAKVSEFNLYRKSPLYLACEGGHKKTVQLLLKNKANVSQYDIDKKSPLYAACKGGYTDTVELLLKNNANVSQCNKDEKSPLYVACKGGHKETVDLLLRNNAVVSQCSVKRWSPLYVACKGGHKDTVELLLNYSADVTLCNYLGESPLYAACDEGHTNVAELLLQNNPDVSQCNNKGKSLLFVACTEGYTNIVQMLLHNNANVIKCDENGESSLYAACERGHPDIVELLLQKKADVSQCDIKGESPLHAVCSFHCKLQSYFSKNSMKQFSKRYIETVKILLAWKADVTLRNKNGKTPLDIARESTFVELVNLFEENLKLKESQLK